MSLPRKQANLPTAGQYEIVHPTAPSDEVGWTSEAPSRRSPKPRRSKRSQVQAPYDTAKPARPSQKKDPKHIPRPSNSFFLFRHNYVNDRPPNTQPEGTGKTLSKQAAEAWKHLPAEVKFYWECRAIEAKKEHARRYPGYKYCPVRRKNLNKAKEQTDTERNIEESSVTFHSTESSPDPAPAPASDSVSSNTTCLASLRVPPLLPNDSVTITTLPIHPQIVQLKQSLRLSSWDDSVIHSQGLSNSFHDQSQGDPAAPLLYAPTDLTWEALRRQSSSAPLPDHSTLSVPNSVVPSCQPDGHDNKVGAISSYYPPPSRRTSYSSGIRPGFVYQDTVFPIEDTAYGDMLTSVPIEPLIAQPVDFHNVCYPSGISVNTDATIAPTSLINPQPALSWSSGIDASRTHPPSSMAADSFMFVSPIQPLPSYLHLDVNGNDHQFNQRWSELSFCSSPEQLSFPVSNFSTVETANIVSANLDVSPAGTTSMVSEVEKRGEIPVVEKNPLNVEQVAVGPGAVPRPVQERHTRSSKHSLLYNPYAYKPRKPIPPPPPQIQAPVLVEDLFKAGPSEDSYYGSEFHQYTENSHSSDIGTDSTPFSAASMDPLLNFFPISYDCGSQGFDSSWALFDGVVEA